MASAVSYEYLKAIQGVPGGIPVLDGEGKIPSTQVPLSLLLFLGRFATEADLIEEYDEAEMANFAYVDETSSFWYWNAASTIEAWVNQEITDEDYDLQTDEEKSMVPYLIIPPVSTSAP